MRRSWEEKCKMLCCFSFFCKRANILRRPIVGGDVQRTFPAEFPSKSQSQNAVRKKHAQKHCMKTQNHNSFSAAPQSANGATKHCPGPPRIHKLDIPSPDLIFISMQNSTFLLLRLSSTCRTRGQCSPAKQQKARAVSI